MIDACFERRDLLGLETPPLWLAIAVALVVLAFKAPDSLAHPQFWAEDGEAFFRAARDYHAVPRLVAWVASWFPSRVAPAIYCYSAWLIGALGLASLRQLRIGVPFSILIAALALTPTNGEIFGTLTTQWPLQFYLLSAFARPVQGHLEPRPVLRCVLARVVGLSGPFSIFVTLSAAACWLLSRALRRWLNPASPTLGWNL